MIKKMVVIIYFILGVVFLALALCGIVVPLLPTTPFVLLALYCFDRSSKKFHNWCLNIPFIGKGIEDWTTNRIIGLKAKVQATILILISALVIIFRSALVMELKIVTLSILAVVLVFLLTRRSQQ